MGQPNNNQPKTSPFNTMRAKGWALCLLGLALLTFPLLLGQSPLLAAYGNALRPAGWFAFAAGSVLLGLHHIAQAKRAKAQVNTVPQATGEPPATGGQATLREIREELKRKAGDKT